ncbi:uncharacterized protein LOC112517810 [Cynara cardunculus var. scolymus]|uniref:uncharacterized protein LOC112517810 n=1 Tax=Cynara cardunculus var. scolymus TaxID=59895 RepID=UPI000D6316CF|nr:uncharacterized protein LOC112517810 [Cynara cardunculus var. scolymus]
MAGNLYFVSLLVSGGADVNHRGVDGESVMSLAVRSGNCSVVRIMVKCGFTIDHSFDRFLHDAATVNGVDIMEILGLSYLDIDMNPVDSLGRTGHEPTVEFLLSVSSYVKYAVTDKEKTAVDLAIEKGHTNLYDMLRLGDVLRRAVTANNVRGLEKCLAEGAKVDRKDQNGWTALHRAAFKGWIESVELLLDHGARVDLVDDVVGCTALHQAVDIFVYNLCLYTIENLMLLVYVYRI